METAVVWAIRVFYAILLLATIVAGIIISFIGAYDPIIFTSNKEQIFTTDNTTQADGVLIPTTIVGFNGVLGVELTIGGTKDPINIGAFTTVDGSAVERELILNSGDAYWYEVSMNEGSTLQIAILLGASAAPVSWSLVVYSTEDLRVVPRVVGPIIFVLFVAAIIIYEIRLQKYLKKYGAGSEGESKLNRRKTRFFAKPPTS